MVRLSSTSDFGNSRKEQRPEAAASPAAGVVQGEGTNFYYYNQQPAINHQFHAEDLKVAPGVMEGAPAAASALVDPNQTYILSGPYLKFDSTTGSYVQVFTARPIPNGMTVIATPASQPPALANSGGLQFNPEATPFVPKAPEQSIPFDRESSTAGAPSGGETGDLNAKHRIPTTPCFMYWSAQCPEGRLIPCRQPQPPVYFHTEQASATQGTLS